MKRRSERFDVSVAQIVAENDDEIGLVFAVA